MGTRTGNAVVEMLKEDHEKVKGLFEEFKETEGKEKAEIAKTVIQELEVHADLGSVSFIRQSVTRSMRTTR